MTNDQEIRKIIHQEIDRSFAYIDDRPSLRCRILREARGEHTVKKTISFTLVFAIVMTLALSGMAAGLSMLEHFGQERKWDQPWVSERLERVQQQAVHLNKTIQIETPAGTLVPETVKEQLAASLYGRKFELTVEDVYCDGNKLYYSYTFKHDPDQVFKGEGWPEGFEKSELKRFYDEWAYGDDQPTFGNPNFEKEESDWYQAHDASWFAAQSCGIGDGVELTDGTSLQIWDNYIEDVDEQTTQSYYEVELPKDYKAGDMIDVVMTVLYNTKVGYADETGVYWGAVGAEENAENSVVSLVRVPVSIPVTGKTAPAHGSAEFDAYSVSTDMEISIFDISGQAVIRPAVRGENSEDHDLAGYILVADGTEYEDYCSAKTEPDADGSYTIEMRFDLPKDVRNLSLRPIYRDGSSPEEEAIILKQADN